MAMIQLLLGNMGVPGGGVNALRGHSIVQGITDLALLSTSTPGYLALPHEKEVDFASYMKPREFKPMRPGQTSFWQNYKKFFVSQQKSFWGAAATKDNDWAYDYVPKWDVGYDVLKIVDAMYEGKINGVIAQGLNVLLAVPNKAKAITGLSKLKWLVTIDPLDTETARFWQNHGEFNDVDPAKIQTEVFQLPAGLFAEEDGSYTNSSRVISWHWKAAEPPGEARGDAAIVASLFRRIRALYVKEGGTVGEPIINMTWNYSDPDNPAPEEVLKEINGVVLENITDPQDPTRIVLRAGQQVPAFVALRDDGKTASGCWIYTGVFTDAGNMSMRRDTSDPSKMGVHPNWGYSWPANRRVLYNRASADANGKPWSERKKYVQWDGAKWASPDVPDYGVTVKPEANVGAFIMNPEGVARLFTRGMMRDGPFPEHYEPFESPVANALHPSTQTSPVARVFKQDLADMGKPDKFPYVATTYRLTEHFHYWTKNQHINAVLQPELFVELPEALAKEKGIQPGGWVKISSNRGMIKAKAVITKRLPTLMVDGKPIHVVGLPIHYGFVGAAQKGYSTNILTPSVGDANVNTPEYKAFLVNVEATSPPATQPVV